jgi:hypothetical protein
MTDTEVSRMIACYEDIIRLLKRANALPVDSLERFTLSLEYAEKVNRLNEYRRQWDGRQALKCVG